MDEWIDYARSLKEIGKTYSQITLELYQVYVISKSVDQLRHALAPTAKPKILVKTDKQEVVGIIGDTHFPFAHPNYLTFLQDTFKKHGVTKIIHIGDMCDNHAISRWQSEADADSANMEFKLAMNDVEQYSKVFPEVTLLLGNHCRIPERQAATLGIPAQFLKGTKELWNLPDKWTVDEQVIIDNVLYDHGINAMGINGAINKATTSMMSCVIGHSHGFGGCQYRSNARSLIFGLNVGCGISINQYAFRYGKYNRNRETLGCGIVYSSAEAYFIPMGAQYFRS